MKYARIILLAVTVTAVSGIFIFQQKALVPEAAPENGRPAPHPRPLDDVVSSAFDATRGNPTSDTTRESLLALRKSLIEMPAARAVAAIRGFLTSGRDFKTGQPFEIAADGSLTTAPTFRCFLLDLLPTIDASAAAVIGREILAQATTADEWALALRNLARGEPLAPNSDYLQRKTEELIASTSFSTTTIWPPSTGFACADVWREGWSREKASVLGALAFIMNWSRRSRTAKACSPGPPSKINGAGKLAGFLSDFERAHTEP